MTGAGAAGAGRLDAAARAAEQALAPLEAGDALILRHYDLPRPEREALAKNLLGAARKRGARLLIGGDAGLARRLMADGVHYPEYALRPRGKRIFYSRPSGLRPSGWIITAAAHSEQALLRAAEAGADAALLSPVFPTSSHKGAKILGVIIFSRLLQGARLPVYALGGMTSARWSRIRHLGAAGWAAARPSSFADPFGLKITRL